MDSSKILPNLDDFVDQGEIAKGGYANIYKVVNIKEPDIILVAKISSTKFLGENDDESLKKFITREVNILAQMNHPTILKFIACCPLNFRDEPYPVIITEYLRNGTLYRLINLDRNRQSPPEWNDTKKLINIYGIAKGMSYIHSNDVIHRDLKPDNIFEDDHLFPKIADFGTSKPLNYKYEDKLIKSNFSGCPSYVPPEFIERNEFGKEGDVFSFAFVVYQIITRQIPYKGLKEYQIYDKVIKNERPTFPNNTLKCYVDLITSCWDMNPKSRPTFDQIVNILRTKKQFITPKTNEKEFNDYIKLLDADGQSIDLTKKFQKVTVSRSFLQIKDDINSVTFEHISQLEIYKKMDNKIQRFLKEKLTLDGQTLYLTYEDTNFLFLNNYFKSDDFISILYSWSSVTVELKQKSKYFQAEFDFISLIAIEKAAHIINFHLIISDPLNLSNLIRFKKIPISVTIEPSSSLMSIEPKTFSKCFSLSHVNIPPTVTRIGENCFESCIKLEEVVIPDTVTEIDSNAFKKCLSLYKVKIPPLTEIKSFTFFKCEILKEVEIPPSVTVIGIHAFDNCVSLEKVTLHSNITDIRDFAFSYCSALKEITIPPKLKILKNGILQCCTSLIKVTIPKSIEIIESYAFNNCTNLKEIEFELPSSLSVIKHGAFVVCSSLENIAIPPSVKSIESFNFYGCKSLKKIIISNLNVINESLFSGCIELEKITIPSPACEICKYAFEKCIKLNCVMIPFSVISIGDKAFNLCSSLVSLTIPSSVTSIGSFAFSNCSVLNNLTIPSSVREIGIYAFRGCISLKKLTFQPSITKIENSLFEGCTGLESFDVPPSVTEIGKKAFQTCSKLKNLTLPSSLIKIDCFAFFGCSSLEMIKIPPNVKEIGENVFNGCNSLVKMEIYFSFQMHDLAKHIGIDNKTKVKRYIK